MRFLYCVGLIGEAVRGADEIHSAAKAVSFIILQMVATYGSAVNSSWDR